MCQGLVPRPFLPFFFRFLLFSSVLFLPFPEPMSFGISLSVGPQSNPPRLHRGIGRVVYPRENPHQQVGVLNQSTPSPAEGENNPTHTSSVSTPFVLFLALLLRSFPSFPSSYELRKHPFMRARASLPPRPRIATGRIVCLCFEVAQRWAVETKACARSGRAAPQA